MKYWMLGCYGYNWNEQQQNEHGSNASVRNPQKTTPKKVIRQSAPLNREVSKEGTVLYAGPSSIETFDHLQSDRCRISVH